jgi:hypothetical protein
MRVRERFSEERMGREMDDIYRSVIGFEKIETDTNRRDLS